MNQFCQSGNFLNRDTRLLSLIGPFIIGILLCSFHLADDPDYREKIDLWHRERVNLLKSENGWLNLAGLFWLKEGKNSLGRGTSFDVAFPTFGSSVNLGTLSLQAGEVQFSPAKEAGISVDGNAITAPLTIFSPNAKLPVLAQGSLRWFIIKRGNKYGVRLRDLASSQLKEFQGIDRYPTDKTWHITAQLESSNTPKTLPIVDVLGQTSQYPMAGTLVFKRAGQTYRLDAANEGERLFILFGDQTNGHDTYGAGRFLYAAKADSTGRVVLDFNQAINPPCAFTIFATCPLPPPQNKLALAITAGEKRYGDH